MSLTEDAAARTADTSAPPRGGAGIGAVAALCGLAAAEVLGLVLPDRPSPVAAIADRVIAGMPDAPREVLISAVGTLDKPLLVIGVVAGVVGAGALIGLIGAARPTLARILFVLGGALGYALLWPSASAAPLAYLVVVAAGVIVALAVWEQLTRRSPDAVAEATGTTVGRRTVVTGAGVLALSAAVALGAAAVVRRSGTAAVDKVRAALRLPAPTDPAPPLPAGATPQVAGLAPAVTPNADFYRIDTAIGTPAVDVASWQLTVGGRVDRPITLTYEQLLARPSIERYVTLACVSNGVGGDLVSNARWQGVRLADLLAEAGAHSDADLVLGMSTDGFTAGFPRSVLDDGRDAMVAYAMNGEALPAEHGFPARLVVPGLYGYVSATKWLTEIRLTTLADDTPFWVARGWSADGSVESASRIDVPSDGATVRVGRVVVAGRAWHQHHGIGGVEVSVDGGAWQQATLAAPIGTDTWRLWTWEWDATTGDHHLRVRMRDVDGAEQSGDVHDPFPGASSGWHTIEVQAV
jgi:DMSO/TMAO reductase YedYZ molybdopterin-dependent catalytic subunit